MKNFLGIEFYNSITNIHKITLLRYRIPQIFCALQTALFLSCKNTLISHTFTISVPLLVSIQKTPSFDLHSYREITEMPETGQW